MSKYILTIVLFSSSCFLIDYDQPTSIEQIIDCSTVETKSNIYGQWLIENSLDSDIVLFNIDKRYFIIRNREILQSGKFKIQPQQNGQYNIETTPEEFKIDGLLYVCNKHTAYHPKTKTIWHFYCDCFIK